MSSATVYPDLRSAARERLITLDGLPEGREWEGVVYKPVVGKPWLREQLLPTGDYPLSNGVIAHEMLYAVTLFYPSGGGTLAIEQMAGRLMDLFKVSTKLGYGSSEGLCWAAVRGPCRIETDWVSVLVRVNITAHTAD